MRSLAEINEKIKEKRAVVLTVEELKARVAETSVAQVAKEVDVVTTGTFEPMESSGAIINLGHTDPPIKIRRCWLDGVLAYSGFGAVDLYLGATEVSEDGDESREIGGGHVIANLIAGKPVHLRAIGQETDCYPRSSFETTISRDTINQFYLYNPRNLYQNFIVGVNGGDRPLYTYLGPLQPRLGNAVYSSTGALSPLLNDPELKLIGRWHWLCRLGRHPTFSPAKAPPQPDPHWPCGHLSPNWGCQTNESQMGTGLLLQKLWPLDHAWGRRCLPSFKRSGGSMLCRL